MFEQCLRAGKETALAGISSSLSQKLITSPCFSFIPFDSVVINTVV